MTMSHRMKSKSRARMRLTASPPSGYFDLEVLAFQEDPQDIRKSGFIFNQQQRPGRVTGLHRFLRVLTNRGGEIGRSSRVEARMIFFLS